MTHRLGLGVVVLAGLLPWASIVYRAHPNPLVTFQDGPTLVYTLVALMLGGAALAAWDRWLGLFVVYMAVLALVSETNLALATAMWLSVGAVGLVVTRRAPIWLVPILLASAVGQTLWGVMQLVGYDPVWGILPFAHGTFGNSKYLGAFLAVVTPLAPLWLLPVLLAGIVMSRSWLAALAVCVGILIRPGMSRQTRLLAGCAGLLGVLGVMWTRGTMLYTASSRWEAWSTAAGNTGWLEALIGHGPGAWYLTVPKLQAKGGDGAEIFLQAHSDVVQLAYEGGLVALAFLGMWLWTHRGRLWRSPYRGAVVAVGIEALALHPFHLATVAPAAIVVLGLATRD